MKNQNWNNTEIGDKGPKGIETYLNELTYDANKLVGKLSYKRKPFIGRIILLID